MEPLSLRESQMAALDVLLKFDDICKENNFKFFLWGGTLLGAIRNNGFIPWDDDLDVVMLRADFDKFIKYAKNNQEKIVPYRICDRENTKNYPYGIPRFCNMEYRYITTSKKEKPFDIGAFIDIYPFDNCGNTRGFGDKLWRRCKIKNLMFFCYISKTCFPDHINILKGMIMYLISIFVKLTKKNFEKTIENEVKEIIFEETDANDLYVGKVVWSNKYIYNRKEMKNFALIDHEFEGHYFPIPQAYDYMLTNDYGDYMELPPEEERKPYHNYKLYRRE